MKKLCIEILCFEEIEPELEKLLDDYQISYRITEYRITELVEEVKE